ERALPAFSVTCTHGRPPKRATTRHSGAMSRRANWIKSQRSSRALAAQALRARRFPQAFVAAIASVAVGLVVGLSPVLIPSPVFARDIPPVAWNYPAWIVTSVLMGMLIATYVRPLSGVTARGPAAESAAESAAE